MTQETDAGLTTLKTPGRAFADELVEWASNGVKATVYLITGACMTSAAWHFGADGLLSFEGDGGAMHIINPAAIVAIHYGTVNDRDPSFLT